MLPETLLRVQQAPQSALHVPLPFGPSEVEQLAVESTPLRRSGHVLHAIQAVVEEEVEGVVPVRWGADATSQWQPQEPVPTTALGDAASGPREGDSASFVRPEGAFSPALRSGAVRLHRSPVATCRGADVAVSEGEREGVACLDGCLALAGGDGGEGAATWEVEVGCCEGSDFPTHRTALSRLPCVGVCLVPVREEAEEAAAAREDEWARHGGPSSHCEQEEGVPLWIRRPSRHVRLTRHTVLFSPSDGALHVLGRRVQSEYTLREAQRLGESTVGDTTPTLMRQGDQLLPRPGRGFAETEAAAVRVREANEVGGAPVPARPGDRVGVRVDVGSGTITFTLNGEAVHAPVRLFTPEGAPRVPDAVPLFPSGPASSRPQWAETRPATAADWHVRVLPCVVMPAAAGRFARVASVAAPMADARRPLPWHLTAASGLFSGWIERGGLGEGGTRHPAAARALAQRGISHATGRGLPGRRRGVRLGGTDGASPLGQRPLAESRTAWVPSYASSARQRRYAALAASVFGPSAAETLAAYTACGDAHLSAGSPREACVYAGRAFGVHVGVEEEGEEGEEVALEGEDEGSGGASAGTPDSLPLEVALRASTVLGAGLVGCGEPRRALQLLLSGVDAAGVILHGRHELDAVATGASHAPSSVGSGSDRVPAAGAASHPLLIRLFDVAACALRDLGRDGVALRTIGAMLPDLWTSLQLPPLSERGAWQALEGGLGASIPALHLMAAGGNRQLSQSLRHSTRRQAGTSPEAESEWAARARGTDEPGVQSVRVTAAMRQRVEAAVRAVAVAGGGDVDEAAEQCVADPEPATPAAGHGTLCILSEECGEVLHSPGGEGESGAAVTSCDATATAAYAVTEGGAALTWDLSGTRAGNDAVRAPGAAAGCALTTVPFPLPQHAAAPIPSLRGKTVVAVACGDKHVLWADSRGALFAMGSGRYGALGQGDCVDRPVARHLESLEHTRVCAVAAGGSSSFAIDAHGALHSAGDPCLIRRADAAPCAEQARSMRGVATQNTSSA